MKGTLITLSLLISCLFFVWPVWAIDSGEIVSAINDVRVAHSESGLNINVQLQEAAELKLSDMQNYKYWAHNNPVNNQTWYSFLRSVGFYGQAGENLARNYSDSQQIVNAWASSASHRENMLNREYSQIGIAVGKVNYPEGTKIVIVAEFGKPIDFLSKN